jgi:hypothetical protein
MPCKDAEMKIGVVRDFETLNRNMAAPKTQHFSDFRKREDIIDSCHRLKVEVFESSSDEIEI